jgi:hypothetical protein
MCPAHPETQTNHNATMMEAIDRYVTIVAESRGMLKMLDHPRFLT